MEGRGRVLTLAEALLQANIRLRGEKTITRNDRTIFKSQPTVEGQ
jgi:hypothetical protein